MSTSIPFQIQITMEKDMLKIAICDDDPGERRTIDSLVYEYCKESGLTYESEQFASAAELLSRQKEYGLYLLDVLMPGCDGVSAAKVIRERDPDAIIVFITSSLESAVDGYRVEASGFLLKPLSIDSFRDTMDRLSRRGLIGSTPMLTVNSRHTQIEIPLIKIIMMESDLHRIHIHTCGETFTINERLNNLEEQAVSYPAFLRCHQSFLVNLDFVEDLHEGCFLLKEDAATDIRMIPISRSRYKYCKMEFYRYRLNRLR